MCTESTGTGMHVIMWVFMEDGWFLLPAWMDEWNCALGVVLLV